MNEGLEIRLVSSEGQVHITVAEDEHDAMVVVGMCGDQMERGPNGLPNLLPGGGPFEWQDLCPGCFEGIGFQFRNARK